MITGFAFNLLAFFSQFFPNLSLYLRQAGAFSAGCQGNNCLVVESRVLGVKDWQPVFSTETATRQKPLLQSNSCQQKLTGWLEKQPGQWAVNVYDPLRQEEFIFNEQAKFHAASVMKMATAISVFDWMNVNKLDLHFSPQGQSLKNKLSLLINRSDNYQWAELGSLVGLANTQKLLEKNGLKNSNIYNNTMTAEDISLLLTKVYQGNLVSPRQRAFLLTAMQGTINENRLPQGVPEEVAVAHKYGSWQANIHDAGIVFQPENPYIITVLTNGVPGAEVKIAEFSSLVYQLFSSETCQRLK